MALLQRFDDEATPPITAEDIQRRWVTFHKQIRLMSGTRFQRTAGRILGEETWRYHTARFIFRPLLKVLRLRRRKNVAKVTRVIASKAAMIFPINYRPLTIDYDHELATISFDDTDVTMIEIDETTGSARDLVNQLNDILNETTSEWLFLADSTLSDESRRYSVAKLLDHVRKDDDVVYADESGPNEFAPILKSPAVGPHTLLSYNVVGRPALLRVETLFRAGGFSPDAGWAFEHDAYLKLNEKGARFHHVPIVLPAGRGTSGFDETRVAEDTCRVVHSAIERRGWRGSVSPGALPGLVHWSLEVPTPSPSIDIIIPTRDRIDLVEQCIISIEENTTYQHYDIIILDNDSINPESLAYFESTKYRVIPCPGPFNYAKIVNRGVDHSDADYIVTLNNDTIVVTPDWLEQMLALASLPDVGIVGACLLDREGRREHESIIIAPYPQHLRTDSNYTYADYFSSATRDVAAVTGAVQMIKRDFWHTLGGMDEQLRVVMNDVDICLRAQMEDRYVLYTPGVQLYHHVGSSRGDLDPIDDRDRFVKRWDIFGSFRDPFFPESLVLLGEKMFYLLR